MDDLISRQAAIDAVKERITFAKAIRPNGDVYNLFESENAELEKAIANIKNLPSAEKTGRWRYQGDRKKPMYAWFFCSNCGSYIGEPTKYCSECGCRMIEEGE